MTDIFPGESIPFGPMFSSTGEIIEVDGLSLSVSIRVPNGAFVAPSGSIRNIGHGMYEIVGNIADTATMGLLLLHADGPGAIPFDAIYRIRPNGQAPDAEQIGLLGQINSTLIALLKRNY